jgi:hypothetical protein
MRRAVRPAKNPMQADERVCWSCGGAGKCAPGEQYCTRCHLDGKATPFIPCTTPGCNNTRRRQIRGEQLFTCATHRTQPDAGGQA